MILFFWELISHFIQLVYYNREMVLYLHGFMYYLKAKVKQIYNNNNNSYKTIAVAMTDFLSCLVIINYLSECMSKMLKPSLFPDRYTKVFSRHKSIY